MGRRIILLVAIAVSYPIASAAGEASANLADQEWGQTRCDLVSPENREACMAAHARLGIPSDKTTAVASPATAPATATASAVPAGGDPPDVPEVARAKKVLADRMKDPTSVLFKDVVYTKEKQAVCGSVNAKNSYGAYGGYDLFAVGPNGEVHLFDGSTTCYGSDKYECYKRKTVDIRAIQENCSVDIPISKFPDDPKQLRARVETLGEDDGAMAWALQDDALAWLERNQASTDSDVVKAMVDLCDLMSNRGSKPYAARLVAIEKNAANEKVRSECTDARESMEDMD